MDQRALRPLQVSVQVMNEGGCTQNLKLMQNWVIPKILLVVCRGKPCARLCRHTICSLRLDLSTAVFWAKCWCQCAIMCTHPGIMFIIMVQRVSMLTLLIIIGFMPWQLLSTFSNSLLKRIYMIPSVIYQPVSYAASSLKSCFFPFGHALDTAWKKKPWKIAAIQKKIKICHTKWRSSRSLI